jgi:predicted translin family RNA/ssDNA-binding protein
MIDPKYFGKVREELLAYAEKRREVIKMTGDAQHQSKRAIFALQRDDAAEAKKCLGEAENLLMSVNKKFQKDQRLFNEGSYRASLEEFAEAMLFNQFLNGKSIGEIKGFKIDPDLYISGLADVPGEILRYAIKSATERNFLMVKKCYEVCERIISEMVDMDLTGYNRQKFDQAKGALNKLQQVVYEVSLQQK